MFRNLNTGVIGVRAALSEALEIARKTGVRIHFAHFRTSSQNAGRSPDSTMGNTPCSSRSISAMRTM